MSGWYVTANDIAQWTATHKRKAEGLLPEIIERLILESCTPEEISFPSGDLVSTQSWDGILRVTERGLFYPSGESGWELGTNYSINGKANDDYQKRIQNPDNLNISETVFVFTTTRKWTKKNTWIREKREEALWRDVIGINAETLETWFRECPGTHRWFAQIIGKRTPGLLDLDEACITLSNIVDQTLKPDMFLHSRENEQRALIDVAENGSSVFRISAQTALEAYGFIIYTLKTQKSLTPRTLIVKNQTAWDWIIGSKQSLILIPDGFIPKNIGKAKDAGYTVIIATDSNSGMAHDLLLAKMPYQSRLESLKSLGFSESQANQIFHDTKGYFLPIIRHQLLKPIDYFKPEWVDAVNSDIVFAAIFATTWDSENEYDKDILTRLSSLPYNDYERALFEISKESDPPVRMVGHIWQVISKIDLWLIFASKLNKHHIDRLGDIIEEVLLDSDPSYELNPDERYLASIKGAVPNYSSRMKFGLSDSLALLSSFGDDYENQVGGIKPSDIVSSWANRIFRKSSNAQFWYSLDQSLLPLAEAAPMEFLGAVERGSVGENPPLKALFQAEGDGLFGGCPHSSLLWSLESISWNTQYLSHVCISFSQLSEIDPGGNYVNRPFNSLNNIMLGWINNTSASHEERLQIIEKVLLEQFPETTWRLMISLLFDNTRISDGVHKPKYQNWSEGITEKPTRKKYITYVNSIVTVLLNNIDRNVIYRIGDLFENLGSFDIHQRNQLFERAVSLDPNSLENDEKKHILSIMRDKISNNRQYADTDWAWSEDVLIELEKVYHHLDFEDVSLKHIYLFNDQWPNILNPTKYIDVDSIRKDELLVKSMRIEALEEIYRSAGVEGIIHLVEMCEYPGIIGNNILHTTFCDQMNSILVDWFENGSDNQVIVSQLYLKKKSEDDYDFVDAILNQNSEWSTQAKVNLLLALPLNSELINLVNSQNDDVQNEFWTKIDFYRAYSEEPITILNVAQKLFAHNRPLAALDSLSILFVGKNDTSAIDSGFIGELLIRIINDPSDEGRVHFQRIGHEIILAIEFLQDRKELPPDKIAQIEWMYLMIFRFDKIKPRYLFEKVASDPLFFVQLITWAYKREDDKKDPDEGITTEQVQNRAQVALELLVIASIIPGQNDNDVDDVKLGEWVDVARDKLKNVGRTGIGDDRIGEYLSKCPDGKDGIWPNEAVRRVIERLKSTDFETAMICGKQNLRGGSTRSPFDGGIQERDLCSYYETQAKKIEIIYPRTANLLFRIARYYQRDASREDRDVQLRE